MTRSFPWRETSVSKSKLTPPKALEVVVLSWLTIPLVTVLIALSTGLSTRLAPGILESPGIVGFSRKVSIAAGLIDGIALNAAAICPPTNGIWLTSKPADFISFNRKAPGLAAASWIFPTILTICSTPLRAAAAVDIPGILKVPRVLKIFAKPLIPTVEIAWFTRSPSVVLRIAEPLVVAGAAAASAWVSIGTMDGLVARIAVKEATAALEALALLFPTRFISELWETDAIPLSIAELSLKTPDELVELWDPTAESTLSAALEELNIELLPLSFDELESASDTILFVGVWITTVLVVFWLSLIELLLSDTFEVIPSVSVSTVLASDLLELWSLACS